MVSRIGEIVVDCADPEASAAFWCAALGYRVTDRDETGVAIAGHPTSGIEFCVMRTTIPPEPAPFHD